MKTTHFADFTVQTPDLKVTIPFSVFNGRFVLAQRMLGEMILQSNQAIMPIRDGRMRQMSRTEEGGRRIVFPGPYARFQWGGLVMVDPDTGSPWAQPGAKKVLTDRPLKYGDPNATDHWTDEAWARNGEAIMKKVAEILEGKSG